MTEDIVPDEITVCSPADVYDGLTDLWPVLAPDASITRAARLVLISQWALETAGGHAMHCWNFGNAKHVRGDGHAFTQFTCGEEMPSRFVQPGPLVRVVATYQKNGEEWSSVQFKPPHPATSFLAFATLEDGLRYWATAFRGRWRSAWPFALAGDVPGFAGALHSMGYYTAAEAEYRAGMLRWYHQLDASIPPDQGPQAVAQAALAEEALQPPPSLGDDELPDTKP